MLETAGKMLIGRQFSLEPQYPLLKFVAILADFKIDDKFLFTDL